MFLNPEETTIAKSKAIERLLQRAFSFADSGRWDKGEQILDRLIVGKPWDRTFLLARASFMKRRWIASGYTDSRLLGDAAALYSRCTLLTGSVTAGVNTAILFLFLGNEKEALLRADEVALRCRKLIIEETSADDINYATAIAEANMVMKKFLDAEAWYRSAASQENFQRDEAARNLNLLIVHFSLNSKVSSRLITAIS